MRRCSAAALAAVLGVAAVSKSLAQPTSATQPSLDFSSAATAPLSLPIKAVILYSSGVGYFEHAGTIDGSAVAELHFKTSQINDVLKSLVVEDSGGAVAGVSYPSLDPLQKTLKSFEVDLTGNPSMDQLLIQLRGARVTLSLATEKLDGAILGVEQRIRPAGENKTYAEPVLNIVTDDGLRSIDLHDVLSLKLDDPALEQELNRALAAVAAARNDDKKVVQVRFDDNGQRSAVIGYVVETPIWKASYRLLLGHDSRDILQGWAVVENQTDNDWNNVELSLVSGRPISFVENLYQPLYLPRPTVMPELFASLVPQIYAGGMDVEQRAAMSVMSGPRAAGLAAAVPEQMEPPSGEALADDSVQLDYTRSIAAIASASKLGELFQYTIGNVSLARQSSAMLPILNDPVQIERVSIYNASVLPRNPLNGVRMKNTTGKHLMTGPITVFDGSSYAGDAQIDNIAPGQDRLLSFGVDLEMITQVDSRRTDDVLAGKIVKGVLLVTHKYMIHTVYASDNKSDHDKTLVIEHRFSPGWTLTDTSQPNEKTDTLYRFQETVPAGKHVNFPVTEQYLQDQTFGILDTDLDAILEFTHNGSFAQDVKDALVKAADMKRAIAETKKALKENRGRQQEIVHDQRRIDDTLRTIGQSTQLYNRLLQKLNDQETDLEKLRAQETNLLHQADDQQHQLEDYLANLNIG